MKRKNTLTPHQKQLLKLLFKCSSIRVQHVQAKLRVSFFKAVELIEWASLLGLISNDQPREIYHEKVKQALI